MDSLSEHEEAERAAEQELVPVTLAFRSAFGSADLLLRSYASRFADESPSTKISQAQSLLLARLADELRAVFILGSRGLVTQAASQAANAMEVAFAAAHVGFDEERAADWLRWDYLEKPPWRVKEMAQSAVRDGVDDPSAANEGFYLWYRWFCAFKHANPVLQQKMPVAFNPSQRLLNVISGVSTTNGWQLVQTFHVVLWVAALSTRTTFAEDPGSVDIAWSHLRALVAKLEPLGLAISE